MAPCDAPLKCGYDSENQRKAKPVQFRRMLALASSLTALSLGACTTTGSMTAFSSQAKPPPPTSMAGTYLAANFAAAQGDVKSATGFYADTLKDNPGNADLLERTFLFAAPS